MAGLGSGPQSATPIASPSLAHSLATTTFRPRGVVVGGDHGDFVEDAL
jgi:hypothetical protein